MCAVKWDEVVRQLDSFFNGENLDGLFCYKFQNSTEDEMPLFYDEKCSKKLRPTLTCRFYHGAQKVVLSPIGAKYVIKLPITGYYTDFNEIIRFNFDENDNPFEDENDRRSTLMTAAKQAFLPNYYIGTYYGIPVYIQERIMEIGEECYRTLTSIQFAEITSVIGTSCPENVSACFIYDIIHYYGKINGKMIINEMMYFDDLHDNNYGYLKNGRPVIFDYAENSFWF